MKEFPISRKSDAPLSGAKGIVLPHQGWLLAAVLGLTASAYIAVLRFDFVYDDEGQIIGNAYIQYWRHVPRYFISQVWANIFPRLAGNYYRPLFLLWLRLNDAWFGFNPRGWHATVLGLHLVATLLVFLIFAKITQKPQLAAIGALVFGLHPIHAEVVAWVSGSTESLGAVFFLAAFLAYLKARDGNTPIWITVSCCFFALALFSKETEIVLPVIVLGHAWIYGTPSGEVEKSAMRRLYRSAVTTFPYAPICIFYLFARILVLHGFGHASTRLPWRSVLFTIPSMIAFYFKKWFLPIQLTEFYDMPYWSGWNFWHVFLPALAVAALAVVIWMARRQLGSRDAAFGALWMIAPLLPILDVPVFPTHDIVHDRYFYLPSVGASLLVALAVDWMSRVSVVPGKRTGMPVYVAVFFLLALILAPLTSHEVSFWVDDVTMFARAHNLAPLNPVARNDYAVDLAAAGKNDAARAVFQEALRADPTDWAAYFNLGRIAYQERKYDESEHWLRLANGMNQNMPDVYLFLGMVDLRTNRVPESVTNIRRAVQLRPNDPTYLFAYGVVLAQTGDCVSARVQFRQALEIRPGEGMTQMAMDRCEQIATQR